MTRRSRIPGGSVTHSLRVATIVGTRPQLIKAAALVPELAARYDHVLIDTGQHWDEELAVRFFDEFGLERPAHSLAVSGASQAEQTAAMLPPLERVLVAEAPDVAVVVGDTNSTLAGTLAAAKLGIPVAHVEAGLRSGVRTMPEEINRIVADHLSSWLFAPTRRAVENLASEGIHQNVELVGDLMQDLAARLVPSIADPRSLSGMMDGSGLRPLTPGRYLFATVHRAENRRPEAVRRWTRLLRGVATQDRPVVLALHPGTRIAVDAAGAELGPFVFAIPPQGYVTSLALQLHAAAVLTDSGGVQRESSWLKVPCLVLRETTEWVEAVEESEGRMVILGLDADEAVHVLGRLAPTDGAPNDARARAAKVAVRGAGAASAIATALERRGP